MSKYREAITPILSVISIILSMIAICRAYPHTYDLGMDYQGVIVGILSLLVTVLVGWNIYTIIDFNKSRDKLKELESTISNSSNESLATSAFDVFMIYHYLLLKRDSSGLEYRFISTGLYCIKHLSIIGDIEMCNKVANIITDNISSTKGITIHKELKEELLSTIVEVQKQKSIEGFQKVVELVASIAVFGDKGV